MTSDFDSRKGERGVVSLLTVIFFMIFISLIAVAFTSIVVADQRQTLDNDLSASALAAARSGVEDGKRLILYCTTINPGASGCAEALNSQDNCNAFDATAGPAAHALATSLAVPVNSNGEGVTGGASASAYQQYFTCLTIQKATPSITMPLNAGSDVIKPLKTVSPFTKLQVSWSGEGNYAQRGSVFDGWPTVSDWNSAHYMPVLQVQTIPYSSLANLDAVEAGTRTVYLLPCDGTCILPSNNINILDARSPAGELRIGTSPVLPVACSVLGNSYTCSTTLTGYDSSTQQYYVRVSLLYSTTTTLTLSALDNNGTVNFDGVQPWIDVTGRTNDVFKRVRTQVGYVPANPLPTDALTSAAPICKDMTVTNQAPSSSYDCD